MEKQCLESSWVSDIDGEAAADHFGTSVSLSADGKILAISAPWNNTQAGHVSVYEWNGSIWNKMGTDIDGEALSDYFGGSISLSGDGTILAIGSQWHNAGTGHVRVFKYNGTSWNQLGLNIDGEAFGDFFW